MAERLVGTRQIGIELDGTIKLTDHISQFRELLLAGQLQRHVDQIEPRKLGESRGVVRIAADYLFEIGPSGSRCLGTELMLAGDAAQGQLIDVKIARGRAENGLLLRLAHARMQAAGDRACDHSLDLRNVLSGSRETVAPDDAAVARIDELHVDY